MKRNKLLSKSTKDKTIIKLDRVRKKLTTKKLFRLFKIPLALLVLISAIFLSARLLGKTATSNVTDALRAIPSLFTHSGSFPYEIDSLSFRRVDLIGNDLLLLSTDNARVISSLAKERETALLDSADSKAVTQNGRALIFSNTSGRLALYGKTERLHSYEVDSTISTAALANNGYIAIAYPKDNVQSYIEIIDNNLKTIFKWKCTKEFVTSLALSGNGKYVAFSAIGSKNAEIYSRLELFSYRKDAPSVDLPFYGTTILKVVFTSSDKIIAIGDNQTVVIDKRGSILDKQTYPEASLVAFDSDDSGNTVVCYKEFGGSRCRILRYSSSGKLTSSISVDFVPDSVSIKSSRFAVSSGSEIRTYSTKGAELKKIDAKNPVRCILVSSNNIYTVEGSSICKY